jgi:alpha-L-fucosidase
MAQVTYSRSSPYFSTASFGQFLDVLDVRTITANNDDVVYTIDAIYQFRPDLLAFDLYGDSALWWVFAARNPNVIEDPLLDFRSGVVIQIPTKAQLTADLGV